MLKPRFAALTVSALAVGFMQVLAPACGGNDDNGARTRDAGPDVGQGGMSGSGGSGGTSGGSGGSGGTAASDAGADASDSAADATNPACTTIERDATLTAHLKITADNECEVFLNGTS